MLRHSEVNAGHEDINANGRLCDFAKRLGYPYEGDGICAGVAYVGIQLFLQGQLALFNTLVTYIVAQDADALFSALTAVKEKVKQPGSIITKDDRLLLNVLAFYDMVMLHQISECYTEWYVQDGRDDAQAVYDLLSSDVTSPQRSVTQINAWLRRFNPSQFTEFLISLNNQANKHKLDLALYFAANDHGIAYCYRYVTRTWLIIDANSLPSYRFQKMRFDKRVNHLMSALFAKTDDIILLSKGYVSRANQLSGKEWLRVLWQSELFQSAMSMYFGEMKVAQIRDLLSTAAILGCADVIDQAIKAGHRKLLNKQYEGRTLAAIAAVHGHVNIINKLANAGVDLNARTRMSYTPLMLAAMHGNANVVDALLKTKKVKKNLVSPCGDTAAMLAAEEGHVNTLKVLHRHGYDFNHVTSEGKSVLDVAIDFQQTAVIRYLYSFSPCQPNPNAFFQAPPAIKSGSQKKVSVNSTHTLRSGFNH